MASSNADEPEDFASREQTATGNGVLLLPEEFGSVPDLIYDEGAGAGRARCGCLAALEVAGKVIDICRMLAINGGVFPVFAGHLGSICSGGPVMVAGVGAVVSPFAAHCRVPAETVPKIRSPRWGRERCKLAGPPKVAFF